MDYSVSFVKDYCEFLKEYGLQKTELYQILDVSDFKMQIPFLRIKAEKVNQLFEFVLQNTNDANTGLKLAQEEWYLPDKVIYMLMWNSKSPLDALRIACKYVKLITTTMVAIFNEEESTFSIEFIESNIWKVQEEWRTARKTSLDVGISTVQNSFKKMFNKEHYPTEVRLVFERPNDDEIYYEIFKCPVYFAQSQNILVYDKSVLIKEKNQYFDQKTYESVVKYADELVKQQVNKSEEFAIIVENEILRRLGQMTDFPNIQNISRDLGISIRSFQRKLEAEEITFKEILENVRKNLALKIINSPNDTPISELATYLGYNDASAFIKAFKRWYSSTPNKYKGID